MSMIPITPQQRHDANTQIDIAARALATTCCVRNIDQHARDAINTARDYIGIAETIIANQPDQLSTTTLRELPSTATI
jgi:transcriptional regulator